MSIPKLELGEPLVSCSERTWNALGGEEIFGEAIFRATSASENRENVSCTIIILQPVLGNDFLFSCKIAQVRRKRCFFIDQFLRD